MAAPRASWKGNLRLSLVTCPIELFPATSEKDKVSFNQLNRKPGNRIRYKKIDAGTGEEVISDDIIKAYQFEKDNYVTLEPDELKDLKLDTNHTIEIVSFVPESEIDDLYFNTPYYIAPSEEHGEEAFAVIREAMTEKGMVAIGRVVMGSREHMIAIRPRGKGMVGTTLLYPYEVRKEQSLFDTIPDQKLDREMIGMAHQLMKSKQGHFEPDKFEDRYENALRDLIAKKQKGVTIRSAAPAAAASNVVDLMSALRASLNNNKEGASTDRRKTDQRASARTPAKPSHSSARTRKAAS
jgi:DNA end-binding protein Ku